MHAVFSVEPTPTVRKLRPFTPFWRKQSVVSILLEIFRRLNAASIAFYTSNAMHAVFGVERSRQVRKMRTFTRFRRILSIISLGLQKFRRLNAISVALYTPNATHASFVVERNRRVRKMRPFPRLWRKLCVISLLLEIFRRSNAIFMAFCTPNAMHASFVVERNRRVRELRPFTRFWRKLCVISLSFQIFRRLNAISIAF